MENQLRAEAHALDRVLYVLEERSVRYLMQKDQSFAEYIDELYGIIELKSQSLRHAKTGKQSLAS